MLEITSDHVAKLNDEDLRILVARLCEAELSRGSLPVSAVTAGGDQNAPDGGIDVRVDLPAESACLDFILRSVTGFQVKCSDMPAGAITLEMRPKGVLRSSIRELAIAHGAYVIVSSQGSTADSALRDRRNAMQNAIGDLPDGATLNLDFYDRDRLARWVRSYPGVALWLRERIGEFLSGWRAYGNWAFGDPADSDFLLDDKGRIVSRQAGIHDAISVEQGIAAMRNVLAMPRGIVRLIGLSGMGKTRLVQALFDSRVGHDALDPSIVIYTDQSHEPTPSARDMTHRLAASSLRTIIVVDNCNPATHRVLAQAVGTHGSTLSLITVEYDVADDEPEETQVFQLEPASEQVLVEILKRLVPHVLQTDRHRIAGFSGGNARIALALARTVKHHESLASLNDSELFKRLFHQRQESGEALMRTAEVCSLVYSFDGETLKGDAAELPVLAELADLSAKELYRQVEELRSRDLVQCRSRWRAVLPHAIANRLAHQALEQIPSDLITQTFSHKGRERLLKSFSRRLSYLHDCEPARKIAESWLSRIDWHANPAQLNELGATLFQNLAPLAPEQALQVIEAAALGENGEAFVSTDSSNRWKWAALLRSIAYEPEQFDRAALLLARFSAEEPANFNCNSTGGMFRELFHLYLSGTHALAEQRLAVIRKLLESEDAALQKCALEALDAMLEASHFSSSHDFSFGARSRDFGWEPKTQDELVYWYRAALGLARELALSTFPYCTQVRTKVAQRFRGLWARAGIYDDLERLAKDLAARDGWPDGWIAIRKTIHFNINSMPPKAAERLRFLESELRPRDLAQKVHAYVLSSTFDHLDVADGETEGETVTAHSEAWERISRIVEVLGREVAIAPELLVNLLPELLKNGLGQHGQFGRGLALGTNDLVASWYQFHNVLAALPENDRNVSLMMGFIEAASSRDPHTTNRLLDEAIADPVLGPYFPLLQASKQVDEAGAERIVSSLTGGLTKAWVYRHLSYGRVADTIPSPAFRSITLGVADLPDGFPVAVDLFSMRLHSLKSEKLDITLETAALGRELLTRFDFQAPNQNLDYHLNEIAVACLRGTDAYDDALKVCVNLARALSDFHSGAWHYGAMAMTLFQVQPRAAINALLSGSKKRRHRPLSYLFVLDGGSPVNAAPPEILLTWATKNPADRIPILAEEIRLFDKSGGQQELAWSPLALRLLELAPDRTAILDVFASRFRPRSWSGSLADVLSPYLQLVKKLRNDNDTLMAAWAQRQETLLTKQIEKERGRERHQDESFE